MHRKPHTVNEEMAFNAYTAAARAANVAEDTHGRRSPEHNAALVIFKARCTEWRTSQGRSGSNVTYHRA